MTGTAARTCPAPGLSPFDLVSVPFFRSGQMPNWPQLKDRRSALTQSGRTAIALVAEAAGLAPGSAILMSAYNCGTEVDALLAAGLRPQFVDSDERGFLQIEKLTQAVGPDTKALYIIHPFGWPQPLDEIDPWRRAHKLVLIEDCALALFSTHSDGTPVGTTGDASVFSLTKTLPTPGGALTWTTPWDGPSALKPPPFRQVVRETGSAGKAWLRRRFGIRSGAGKRRYPPAQGQRDTGIEDIPASYYFDEWRRLRRCSFITERLAPRISPETIRKRRRANYAVLSDPLLATGIELLFKDLPEGVCPLSCPIRVKNRNRVVAELQEAGIETSRWWAGGHRDIDWPLFPNARALKRRILPLPVHQQLDATDMQHIVEVMIKAIGTK